MLAFKNKAIIAIMKIEEEVDTIHITEVDIKDNMDNTIKIINNSFPLLQIIVIGNPSPIIPSHK